MFWSVTDIDTIIDVHIFVQLMVLVVLSIQMFVSILVITPTIPIIVLVSLAITWLVMAEHVMVSSIGCDGDIILLFRNR